LGGDIKAMQFYLKTQAGWTEKSHIELSKAGEPEDCKDEEAGVEPTFLAPYSLAYSGARIALNA